MQDNNIRYIFRTSAKFKIQNATERHPAGLVRIPNFV